MYYWNNLLNDNLILEWREWIIETKISLRKQETIEPKTQIYFLMLSV